MRRSITISDIPPPQTVSLTAVLDAAVLNAIGQFTQIHTTAILADGNTLDVTQKSRFTTYRTSNPKIVTVDDDGLVIAGSQRGLAYITATNEGAATTIGITVSPGDPLTEIQGIVLMDDNSPVAGASVSVVGIANARTLTDINGSFTIPNVPTALTETLSVSVFLRLPPNLPLYGNAVGLIPFPDGITDAGVIKFTPFGTNDSDNDGIVDDIELILGFDPNNSDSDNDGTPDQNEDSDNDGLPDFAEIILGTDLISTDTDNDGISDANEDFDFDNVSNATEIAFNTNPFSPDTDGDTYTDFQEINEGTDPTDPNSHPPGEDRQFVLSSPTVYVNIGNQSASEFQSFSLSAPTAFVNIGAQPNSEFQTFSISKSTAYVNVGTQTNEGRSFMISTPVSYNNSP